uniref:ethanolamine kinase n=1 Tax=Taeniopygia guttata TaxID=59729 RepID=H1A4D4_TAEGU
CLQRCSWAVPELFQVKNNRISPQTTPSASRAVGRAQGVPLLPPRCVTPAAFVPTQLFTDGITNKLVACYTLLVDRETELRNFQVLRAHGCAPDLYCAFQNGLCYQFLPGIALGPQHVRDPHICRLVAREMARVHAIHANGSLPRPILWQKLHKYLGLVKTELSPKVSNPSRSWPWMKETLPPLGSPVVLCHNDLLCKNIIYDSTQERVRFIDYEYTGYNYQAFDIGNHFNEFAGGDCPQKCHTGKWGVSVTGMEKGVLFPLPRWEMGCSYYWDGKGSSIPSPIQDNLVSLLLGWRRELFPVSYWEMGFSYYLEGVIPSPILGNGAFILLGWKREFYPQCHTGKWVFLLLGWRRELFPVPYWEMGVPVTGGRGGSFIPSPRVEKRGCPGAS